MAIWGRLRQELDRAGRVAQQALDEGKLRLEVHRARQRADRAAQALGYAVHRAQRSGEEVAPDLMARLAAEITAAEAEADKLEAQANATGAAPSGATPEQQPPV